MQRVVRRSLAMLILAVCASTAGAQQKTSIAFTIAPGFVRFDGFGSTVKTLVAQVIVSRELTAATGAELTGFTAVPFSVVSVQPGCIPGGACQSYSSPSALMGGIASGYVQLGDSPLRLSAGLGLLSARGSEGPGARSTSAVQLGLEWSQQRSGGIRMTAGVRALQFANPISGARQLVLPGVGIRY